MRELRVLLKAGHTVEIIQILKSDFEVQHGCTVLLDVVSEEEAHQRLSAGVSLPDVCTVPYWYLGELVDKNLLAPWTSSDVEGQFHPRAWEALSPFGTTWAIPHTLVGGALAWIRDRVPAGAVPTGPLHDLIRAAGEVPHEIMPLALRGNRHFSSAETYRGLAFAAGVDLIGSGDFPSLIALETALGELLDLLAQRGRALADLDYGRMGYLLPDGHAAMMFDTSAWATLYARERPEAFAAMTFTQVGTPPCQFFYAEGLGVLASSSHQELAREFIRWRQSGAVLQHEILELNRLDFPRLDIRGTDWFNQVGSAGTNARVLEIIDASWASIADNYIVTRSDFVLWAHRLMDVITPVISGNQSLAHSYEHALNP